MGPSDTPSAAHGMVRTDDTGGVDGVLHRAKSRESVAEQALGRAFVLSEIQVVEFGAPRLHSREQSAEGCRERVLGSGDRDAHAEDRVLGVETGGDAGLGSAAT